MLATRRSAERGYADHGWLQSFHSFSFADYYDPRHMGFGPLRVINEDRVAPGMGFGTHGHRDMEIVSYVLEGGLAHKDSLGTGSVITPGDVQYMSAGTGVRHSEFNASKTEPVHFMQIWIMPNAEGLPPRYDQKRFGPEEKRGKLRLVVSPTGEDGSIAIRQDVRMYASLLDAGQSAGFTLAAGRHLWVQVLEGSLDVNGKSLDAGDGLAASDETAFRFAAAGDGPAEFLVFDLA